MSVLEIVDNKRYTIEDIVEAIGYRKSLEWSKDVEELIASSYKDFCDYSSSHSVYGYSTGVGPAVVYGNSNDADRNLGLLNSLMVGYGDEIESNVCRTSLLLRIIMLSRGCSGIHLDTWKELVDLFDSAWTPCVPEFGSLGASGDLVPMTYFAQMIRGVGRCKDPHGVVREARDYLDSAGKKAHTFAGRDALSIVNGTPFMTGYAILAYVNSGKVLSLLETLTGVIVYLLGASKSPYNEKLNKLHGHEDQVISANAIRTVLEDIQKDHPLKHARSLQEPYCLRTAPQILGACREQFNQASRSIENELNGISDNPSQVGPMEWEHGGNFQGMQISFAADQMASALVALSMLADRQVELLMKTETNGGFPFLLTHKPGSSSALAGAQITATSVLAEMRRKNQVSIHHSVPTNGGNQDITSMGFSAAQNAYRISKMASSVVAVLVMAVYQLESHTDRDTSICKKFLPEWAPVYKDRPLNEELSQLANQIIG